MSRRACLVAVVTAVVAGALASLAPAAIIYLTRLEEDSDPPGGSAEGLNGAHTVAPSPDNKNVYVTGIDDDTVVTFKRKSSGALERVEMDQDPSSGGHAEGLDAPEGMAISPDGKHVYVVSVNDNAIVTFKRNKKSGKLKRVEMDQDPSSGGHADGLDHVNSVAVSPDGKHVYTTSSDDDAVVTFKRNKKSGKLKRVEMDQDPSSGGSAEGLDGAVGVQVAPNGKHVYVTAFADDTVVTFKRNKRKGKLKRLEEHRDVSSGGTSEGLDSAVDSAVSPDDENVYVTADEDHAVVTFDRDPATGLLTRTEEHRDVGAGGSSEGLGGANAVDVSADGTRVYVVGNVDDALVVFTRDGSGLLTRVEEHSDVAAGGADEGLDNVRQVAVSPDDDWLYTSARDDDALVTFENTAP